MSRSHKSGERLLITYFLLVGLSICGYWATQLSGSYLADGMATKISERYVIWHVTAEIASGVLALISAFLMLSNNPLGLRLALFTCGMLIYTGLNSIGWAQLHGGSPLTTTQMRLSVDEDQGAALALGDQIGAKNSLAETRWGDYDAIIVGQYSFCCLLLGIGQLSEERRFDWITRNSHVVQVQVTPILLEQHSNAVCTSARQADVLFVIVGA